MIQAFAVGFAACTLLITTIDLIGLVTGDPSLFVVIFSVPFLMVSAYMTWLLFPSFKRIQR